MNKKIAIMMILSILIGGCNSNTNTFTQEKGVQPIYEQVMENVIILEEWVPTERIAYENGKVGYINSNGDIVVDIIYDEIFITNSGDYLGKTEEGYDLIHNYEIVPGFQKVLDILENDYDSYIFDETIGLWRVRKNGKRTFVDMEGKQLTTEMFDYVSGASVSGDGVMYMENVFMAFNKKNNEYYCAVYNLDGEQLTPFNIQGIRYDNNYYCAVEVITNNLNAIAFIVGQKDDTLVYDIRGNLVLENLEYAYGSWGEDCSIEYKKKDGEEKYCLTSKMEETKNEYMERAGDYLVYQEKNKYGVKKVDGEQIIDSIYNSIEIVYATHGYYFLAEEKNKKNLLNSEGEILFSIEEAWISSTENPDIWLLRNSEYEYKLLTKDGEIIIDEWFGSLYVEYYIIVYLYPGYRVYTLDGKILYENKGYTDGYPVLQHLPYYAIAENKNFYVANEKGENLGLLIYNYHFGDYMNYSGKWFVIYQKGDLFILDNGSKQVTIDKHNYDGGVLGSTIQEVNGIFVKKDNMIHFVDESLNSHFKVDAEQIAFIGTLNIENIGEVSYFAVEKNGKYAVMLESGEMLTDYEFDEIGYYGNYGYILVRKDGLWGTMNYRGEVITDFIYDFSALSEFPYYDVIGEWYAYFVRPSGSAGADGYNGKYYYFRIHEPEKFVIPE